MTKKLKGRRQEQGKKIAAPQTTPELSPEQQRPIFDLQYLDRANFNGCDREEKAAFADTLSKLSQLTWSQIRLNNKYKLGYEMIPQDQLRIPLPRHITADVQIMVFRFCSLKPMLGYRVGAIYYPFWLDTAFTAYKH